MRFDRECYLIEFRRFSHVTRRAILWTCGLNEKFDQKDLETEKRFISTVADLAENPSIE